MTVCSYAGTLFFGFVGGRTAMPDLPRLTGHFDAAFRELQQSA
jgi:hypothetical protein